MFVTRRLSCSLRRCYHGDFALLCKDAALQERTTKVRESPWAAGKATSLLPPLKTQQHQAPQEPCQNDGCCCSLRAGSWIGLPAWCSGEQHGVCWMPTQALPEKHDFKGVNCKDLPLLAGEHGAGLGRVPPTTGKGCQRDPVWCPSPVGLWEPPGATTPRSEHPALAGGYMTSCPHHSHRSNVESTIPWDIARVP